MLNIKKQRKSTIFLSYFLFIFLVVYSVSFLNIAHADPNVIRQNIIDEAISHLGDPYQWGASREYESDCSGFINLVLSKSGFSGFDRSDTAHGPTSRTQFHSRVDYISVDSLLPGDLLFMRNPDTGKIYHVGMYLSGEMTIEQGGLRDYANTVRSLSGWQTPPWWAGAGRVKAKYWPGGDNGGDPSDIIVPSDPGPGPGPIPPTPGPIPPTTGEHSFGGLVTNVHYCSCTGNHLLTIDNLSTEGPRPVHLIYQYGSSVVYENGQIPKTGVWLNGLWESKGDSCVSQVAVSCGKDGLSTCLVCSDWHYSDGTITFTGTSN